MNQPTVALDRSGAHVRVHADWRLTLKERIRSFVAVELSPEIRSALGREIARLSPLGADVKWVEPQALHITLKFLGQVDKHAIPEIIKALGSCAGEMEPFEVQVLGVGFFPEPARPRIVAAGVAPEGAKALEALAARVEEALAPLGFSPESRGFRAHVTLGRVKSPKGAKRLADAILTSPGEPFGEQEVREVVLFMSELSRQGPTYTALGRAELGNCLK